MLYSWSSLLRNLRRVHQSSQSSKSQNNSKTIKSSTFESPSQPNPSSHKTQQSTGSSPGTTTLFRASSHSSLAPTVEIGGIWPPKGIGILDPREIPFLNTPIPPSSGAAITWAHHAILAGKEK
ncbi:hypothetical protein AAC387_Pa01g0995 [Persea americana]